MDDKGKNIQVNQGGLSFEKANHQTNHQNNISQNQYINEIEIPIAESPEKVKYDDFMFEPLGFEELEKQREKEIMCIVENNIRKAKRQKILGVLIILLTAIAILITYSIIYRINQNNSLRGKVVIYQQNKPSVTNLEYIDENGKYSTEGIAYTVRPSVVEIYTYYDSAHLELAATGSGIIISEDGYIVTNEHVLEADGYHLVKTSDEKTYNAEIIGRDSKTDIAVIKVNAYDLKPATLGNSDEVVVGEEVMAIGNPAGLSGTVTNGIVSAVNRKIKGKTTSFEMDCIQTNADISPGNSGGALVNMYAQVIGITSSKYASTTVEGLGFAISINEAKPIIEELINNGFISGRFKIGITLTSVSDELSKESIEEELGYSLPDDFRGIYISDISEDCDIANTELKIGDFITKIEGKSVSSYDELYDAIKEFSPNDTVHADCTNIDEDGNITEYSIEFKLMEDTSGDY